MTDLVKQLISEFPGFREVLNSPVISVQQKHGVIEKIAQKCGLTAVMKNFLKHLCDCRETDMLDEILQAYDALWDKNHHILRVKLYSAGEPEKTDLEKAAAFLQRTYPDQKICTEICIDESLIGGMRICAGHEEYDWSYEGRLKQLERKLTGR